MNQAKIPQILRTEALATRSAQFPRFNNKIVVEREIRGHEKPAWIGVFFFYTLVYTTTTEISGIRETVEGAGGAGVFGLRVFAQGVPEFAWRKNVCLLKVSQHQQVFVPGHQEIRADDGG